MQKFKHWFAEMDMLNKPTGFHLLVGMADNHVTTANPENAVGSTSKSSQDDVKYIQNPPRGNPFRSEREALQAFQRYLDAAAGNYSIIHLSVQYHHDGRSEDVVYWNRRSGSEFKKPTFSKAYQHLASQIHMPQATAYNPSTPVATQVMSPEQSAMTSTFRN